MNSEVQKVVQKVFNFFKSKVFKLRVSIFSFELKNSQLKTRQNQKYSNVCMFFFVDAQLSLCTDVGGQCCTSTDPD